MDQPAARDDGSQRTPLAQQRTRLALDRTVLAWWRTAVACYGIGVAIAKALPRLGPPVALSEWLGVAFVAVGILVVLAGSTDVARSYRLSLNDRPSIAVVALTGLFLLLGLACLALTVP